MSEIEDMIDALGLPAHVRRTYTFREIAREIGRSDDALRHWFDVGGLAYFPPFDVPGQRGGRGVKARLHWRSVFMLLFCERLKDHGFGMRNGEAAGLAGAVFTAGLNLSHLCTSEGPLISIACFSGGLRLVLIRRDAGCEDVERHSRDPGDGLEGVGTLIFDPIGFGRIIWRMAMTQAATEAV